jgi:hypothetical protein
MSVGAVALVFLLQVPSSSVLGRPDSTATRRPMAATIAPADSTTEALRRRFMPEPRRVPAWAYSSASDTLPRRRRRSVEYSDWYYRRLQIHRWGSWLELPVFGTEYWLGQKLFSDQHRANWVKPAHATVAGALGGLFAVNTVTGAWNLYDSRNDTEDRALVWTHTALMLASDAGFMITAALAGDDDEFGGAGNDRARHRTAAITSMSLATAGTLLMWIKRGL